MVWQSGGFKTWEPQCIPQDAIKPQTLKTCFQHASALKVSKEGLGFKGLGFRAYWGL